jgi:hypothetical protein
LQGLDERDVEDREPEVEAFHAPFVDISVEKKNLDAVAAVPEINQKINQGMD